MAGSHKFSTLIYGWSSWFIPYPVRLTCVQTLNCVRSVNTGNVRRSLYRIYWENLIMNAAGGRML